MASNLPPNPKQWPIERNGLALRQRTRLLPSQPLRPFDVVRSMPEIEILGRADLSAYVVPETIEKAFGKFKRNWSAVTFSADGQHLIIINDTHALTRRNATLTEELFHILLGHKPSRIEVCPQTGLLKRQYDKAIEDEAYWSAAAALVPYRPLREMLEEGQSVALIAGHFEVSTSLVQFRMKVTRLWRRHG